MNNPLRLALLINNSKELPAWEMEMLSNLQHSGLASVVAFIVSEKQAKGKNRWGLQLFQKFENWWFRSMPDAFKISTVTIEFGSIPTIEIIENENITSLGLDIIYRSCLVAEGPSLSTYANYGEWFIVWGSRKYSRDLPPAFREVMDDNPEIGSALQVQQAGSANPFTIYQATTTTVPYSVKNSLNTIAWKSSSFLPYRVAGLKQLGADLFFSTYKTDPVTDSKPHTYSDRHPSSLKVIVLSIRNAGRYLWNKVFRAFVNDRFTLLFTQQEFNLTGLDTRNFIPLKLPKNVFWADPFVLEKDNTFYIFFEEFIYKTNKAHISMLELTKDGQSTSPVIIIDKPYHLSYPFLFEYGGTQYMIPETSANKTVELYKCSQFPLQWEFVENLMENMVLIDATILFHAEKWWLFGTNNTHPATSTNDQLFLYYSNTLFSPEWKEHPQNPVATKISNCRPAGKIFTLNGKLYRPAQNNASKQYGYGIKINEIEVLTETEYREKEVFDIFPDKKNKLKAIHTINFVNNMIIIDGIN